MTYTISYSRVNAKYTVNLGTEVKQFNTLIEAMQWFARVQFEPGDSIYWER